MCFSRRWGKNSSLIHVALFLWWLRENVQSLSHSENSQSLQVLDLTLLMQKLSTRWCGICRTCNYILASTHSVNSISPSFNFNSLAFQERGLVDRKSKTHTLKRINSTQDVHTLVFQEDKGSNPEILLSSELP